MRPKVKANCYKVVVADGGGAYRSALVEGEAELRYELGKATEAEIGGCFTFDCVAAARHFIEMEPVEGGRVFRAVGEQGMPLPNGAYGKFFPALSKSEVEACWRGKGNPCGWPTGTVIYKRVTLLEEVKE